MINFKRILRDKTVQKNGKRKSSFENENIVQYTVLDILLFSIFIMVTNRHQNQKLAMHCCDLIGKDSTLKRYCSKLFFFLKK